MPGIAQPSTPYAKGMNKDRILTGDVEPSNVPPGVTTPERLARYACRRGRRVGLATEAGSHDPEQRSLSSRKAATQFNSAVC
jgi:hypothetical protein